MTHQFRIALHCITSASWLRRDDHDVSTGDAEEPIIRRSLTVWRCCADGVPCALRGGDQGLLTTWIPGLRQPQGRRVVLDTGHTATCPTSQSRPWRYLVIEEFDPLSHAAEHVPLVLCILTIFQPTRHQCRATRHWCRATCHWWRILPYHVEIQVVNYPAASGGASPFTEPCPRVAGLTNSPGAFRLSDAPPASRRRRPWSRMLVAALKSRS